MGLDERQIWRVNEDNTFEAFQSDTFWRVPNHPLAKEKIACLALPDRMGRNADTQDEQASSGKVDGTRRVPTTLAVALADGSIRVYIAANWQVEKSWQLEPAGVVRECLWSPNHKQLAVAVADRIEIWDVDKQEPITIPNIPSIPGGKLTWNNDGTELIRVSTSLIRINAMTGQMHKVDWTGTVINGMTQTSSSSDETRTIASGTNVFALFDAETGSRIGIPKKGDMSDATMSNKNDQIVQRSWSGVNAI